MLKRSEIYRLVNEYIGVSGGYLGDFSYRAHYEFYPYYCDLNLDVAEYEPGTTREKFINILEDANSLDQVKILEGVFRKYPVSYFKEDERDKKQELYDEYQIIIARLRSSVVRGVNGEIKNLIFASNGPKPEIVLLDATINQIKVVRNEEYCLIYDKHIPEERGLLWEDLVDWWCSHENLQHLSRSDQRHNLFNRLIVSLQDNGPERLFLTSYYRYFFKRLNERLPALIPQVYLHYDPYSLRQLAGARRLMRQRMDFLLILPYKKHIVIEIDGKQHYSEDGVAKPELYAEMMTEDRRLRLTGYELFRFGGYEFLNHDSSENTVREFFDKLFDYHSVK